jgi:hypothetical protein
MCHPSLEISHKIQVFPGDGFEGIVFASSRMLDKRLVPRKT